MRVLLFIVVANAIILILQSCRKDAAFDPAHLEAETYQGTYKCSLHYYTASFIDPPYHEYSYPNLLVTSDTGYISLLDITFHVDSIVEGTLYKFAYGSVYNEVKMDVDSLYFHRHSSGQGGFAKWWYYGLKE